MKSKSIQLRNSVIATTLAALGMAYASQASATAIATSLISISNFTFTDASGRPLTYELPGGATGPAGDIQAISFTDTLQNNATLNGVSSFNQASTGAFVAVTDAAMACVGSTCGSVGENNFVPATPPPTAVYSRSDSILKDQPINVLDGGVSVGIPIMSQKLNQNYRISMKDEGRLVWEGTLKIQMPLKASPEVRAANIQKGVTKLLQKFPPKKK